MHIDWVRNFCLAMPHATESVQWGDDLVFKIAGKMFAVLVLEPAKVWVSFKCTPEEFAQLVERPGIIPAPYSARYHWVALETRDALTTAELKTLLRRSYGLVLEKLPKKARAALVMFLAAACCFPILRAQALPGEGMAQHPFLYCGEWQNRSTSQQVMHIVRGGKIVWSYTNPLKGELGDCTMLSNGNIVFSRQFGASEITPDKKIVWNYDGP